MNIHEVNTLNFNNLINKLKSNMLKQSIADESIKAGFFTVYEYERELVKQVILDVLNEITNDDALGPARINTLKRISERYGVQRKME